jgi:hypothetical protein
MVLINYAGREINAKIVYYGPGLSGKTTNLECIYASVPTHTRGKMVSMKTRQDRTLFFDFLPLELGEVHGFRTRFLLYTVPGQVFYNATRKLVLKGADAVVFVADSGLGKMDDNLESLRNLEENLREQGLALETMPFVLQYNKRDLPEVYSVEEMQVALNPRGVPSYEAAAASGQGVYETLHAVSRLLFQHLVRDLRPSAGRGAPAAQAPAASAPAGGLPRGTAPAGAAEHPGVPPLRSTAPVAPSPALAGPPAAQGLRPVATGPVPGAPLASATGARPAAPRPSQPEPVEPAHWPLGTPTAMATEERIRQPVVEPQPEPESARPQLFGTPAAGRMSTPPTPAEILDSVHASTRALATEATPGPAAPVAAAPGEYGTYGHVVDLSIGSGEASGALGGGFIKDPLRRPEGNASRTQHLTVVVSKADLKPGATVRIVLDLRVEP